MSLVGPRPLISYEVGVYQPWHRKRLETVPSMVGLWQVTVRSSCDFGGIVELDLHTIEHWPPWLDPKIPAMTPLAVFRGQRAV